MQYANILLSYDVEEQYKQIMEVLERITQARRFLGAIPMTDP